MNDESIPQQNAAWMAVCDTLSELMPGWLQQPGTGLENAVAAIRKLAARDAQYAAMVGDGATIAGLESAVGHLSTMVDEQRRLLVEVEQVCGRDAYGMEFEDGDSELIDKVRAHLAATTSAPTPEPMSAPTEAKPAQQDAVDAEAVALSPEQEEWVMDLAQKHNLGRRVGQIGTLQGVSPDVFYTDASYRTQELFDFAAELLASSELNADQRRALVGNWFAEDWAVHQALGLLDDYDTERAAISAKKVGA